MFVAMFLHQAFLYLEVLTIHRKNFIGNSNLKSIHELNRNKKEGY